MNNSNIESNGNSNKNYQGVDDSPYTLAINDPDGTMTTTIMGTMMRLMNT